MWKGATREIDGDGRRVRGAARSCERQLQQNGEAILEDWREASSGASMGGGGRENRDGR